MNKIIEKAKQLKEALNATSEMQEYLKNKKFLENDEQIISLKHQIASLKAKGKLEEAKQLENIYQNHPLVNNYEISRQSLIELLKTIETIIKQ